MHVIATQVDRRTLRGKDAALHFGTNIALYGAGLAFTGDAAVALDRVPAGQPGRGVIETRQGFKAIRIAYPQRTPIEDLPDPEGVKGLADDLKLRAQDKDKPCIRRIEPAPSIFTDRELWDMAALDPARVDDIQALSESAPLQFPLGINPHNAEMITRPLTYLLVTGENGSELENILKALIHGVVLQRGPAAARFVILDATMGMADSSRQLQKLGYTVDQCAQGPDAAPVLRDTVLQAAKDHVAAPQSAVQGDQPSPIARPDLVVIINGLDTFDRCDDGALREFAQIAPRTRAADLGIHVYSTCQASQVFQLKPFTRELFEAHPTLLFGAHNRLPTNVRVKNRRYDKAGRGTLVESSGGATPIQTLHAAAALTDLMGQLPGTKN